MSAPTYPRRFGKYVLLKPLAQGGMGALYLGVVGDRGMEKPCALKTVLPHLADGEYVSRFRDEAKVVVRLQHGNLVSVFDAGQVAGEIYMAMEFVEGKDLRAVWNRCAKKGIAFPIEVAVHITKEVCRGLSYAHNFHSDLKLVHRDVSPPNVLCAYSGEVKLTDFGLATSTLKLEKTAPGVIYGKVSYMAPEQARGEALDGRTDLYATAIILWELLTGRQLFPQDGAAAGSGGKALARVRDPKVEPPSARAARVPKPLDAVVLRALAADPRERYQTCEEFRVALAEFLAKEAPATDASRVQAFLRQLFDEDVEAERRDQARMLEEARAFLAEDAPLPMAPFVTGRTFLHSAAHGGGGGDGPAGHVARAVAGAIDAQRAPLALAAKDDSGEVTRLKDPLGEGLKPDTFVEALPSDTVTGMIGAVIDGRYRVLRLIGEGGMGRVYEAEHTEIGKRVAIKILHPVFNRTPDVVERFRREARAASKIGHPHIVDVTDSGQTLDGSTYFVMEYLEGIDLAEVLARETSVELGRALRIAQQMCRALAAAHEAGIIHRDLKPENIFLVTRDGTSDFVKVLDFGIAKNVELDESTRVELSTRTGAGAGEGDGTSPTGSGRRKGRLTNPGMAMGTPEYMAPEQAAGRPADGRVDIYAVGAILYEMVTGVAPYQGANFMEVLSRKASEAPRPMTEHKPEVPPSVEELVQRALAREPEDRPQTMAAFEYEIAKVIVGRGAAVAQLLGVGGAPTPAGGAPAGAPAPAVGAPRRRARAAVAAGATLALAATAALVLASRGREAPAPAPSAPPAGRVAAPAAPREPEGEAPSPEVLVVPPADELEEEGEPRRRVERRVDEGTRLLTEARGHLRARRFAKAREGFNLVATRSRGLRGPAYVGLAECAFQEQRFDEAVKLARGAVAFGGGVRARMILGNSYFRQEDYARALEEYQRVLKMDPRNTEAMRNREQARRRLGGPG